jgi:flavin-dependent dehydrogenase
VAVFAGERIVTAPMPPAEGAFACGRALGRERLDSALLESARSAGAAVYQPWRAQSFTCDGSRWRCALSGEKRARAELVSRLVIAAHGSWDTGALMHGARSRSQLLAFKATFADAQLPTHRMPLVAFPGGYGGLVHGERERVTFSCCIRRDALARCRSARPHTSAGDAVLEHARGHCRGLREALAGARREEPWLAAGPIRPGIRRVCADGYFAVGNALGEAHPIVAEGISMAIQSAWLLCETLLNGAARADWGALARQYEAAYRSQFALRIRAAAVLAATSMRPRAAVAAATMLAAAPGFMARGAHLAGTTSRLPCDAAPAGGP